MERNPVLFFVPPTSLEHQVSDAASAFKRLNMKANYVFNGLIRPNSNFHSNRFKRKHNLEKKILQVGDINSRALISHGAINSIVV